jgi:hypothetical protein
MLVMFDTCISFLLLWNVIKKSFKNHYKKSLKVINFHFANPAGTLSPELAIAMDGRCSEILSPGMVVPQDDR